MDDVTRRQALKLAATAGVVATGVVTVGGGEAEAAQTEYKTEEITAINECGIPNSNDAAIKVTAGNQSGWVRNLGGNDQNLRIWAALWAVKAALVSGHNPHARLVFQEYATSAGGEFRNVQRVFIPAS